MNILTDIGSSVNSLFEDKNECKELDNKSFLPRRLSVSKLSALDGTGMGVWGSNHAKRISELNLADLALDSGDAKADSKDDYIDESKVNSTPKPSGMRRNSSVSSLHGRPRSVSVEVAQSVEKIDPNKLIISELLECGADAKDAKDDYAVGTNFASGLPAPVPASPKSLPPSSPVPVAQYLPPTWDPVTPFCFPVAEVPVARLVPDNLTMEHFTEVAHIADGSNANVFVGILNGERVIIKMIRWEVQNDPVAVHEFDVEHGMMVRMSHPNILKVYGAGRVPRRFIVLEYLANGTLNELLQGNVKQGGFASKLFHRQTFNFTNLLTKVRELADAFDYLHRRMHPHASVIHRDLKPDNVGFTANGTLKLFDFGLCTTVRRRTSEDVAYDMTGNTGSLRYMAPEVALRQPYTEKVDVYSFGIMVWQMATDQVPFKGMSRDEFMKEVVSKRIRPKVEKSWPAAFSALLTACWDADPHRRPNFYTIVIELDRLRGNTGK